MVGKSNGKRGKEGGVRTKFGISDKATAERKKKYSGSRNTKV